MSAEGSGAIEIRIRTMVGEWWEIVEEGVFRRDRMIESTKRDAVLLAKTLVRKPYTIVHVRRYKVTR